MSQNQEKISDFQSVVKSVPLLREEKFMHKVCILQIQACIFAMHSSLLVYQHNNRWLHSIFLRREE